MHISMKKGWPDTRVNFSAFVSTETSKMGTLINTTSFLLTGAELMPEKKYIFLIQISL
jgi:hypothetical protein